MKWKIIGWMNFCKTSDSIHKRSLQTKDLQASFSSEQFYLFGVIMCSEKSCMKFVCRIMRLHLVLRMDG